MVFYKRDNKVIEIQQSGKFSGVKVYSNLILTLFQRNTKRILTKLADILIQLRYHTQL